MLQSLGIKVKTRLGPDRHPLPTRLRAHGAPDELLQRIRLLGLTGEVRWADPHWSGYRY
ncbi:hypothetical protein [Streptomyces sp. NPDC059080]|uniref:hypothetical protein n=1 Tax=Streptomyces sp. NPDC059080 TaxID=3346718 RepID=UPI0036A4C58B